MTTQPLSWPPLPLRIGDPVVKALIRLSWPEYKGRTVRLRVAEKVHLGSYMSDGGTWSEWKAINLETAEIVEIPCYGGLEAHVAGPRSLEWNTAFDETRTIPGVAYIGRIHFCGKDCGVEIAIHPDNAARLLEAKR